MVNKEVCKRCYKQLFTKLANKTTICEWESCILELNKWLCPYATTVVTPKSEFPKECIYTLEQTVSQGIKP